MSEKRPIDKVISNAGRLHGDQFTNLGDKTLQQVADQAGNYEGQAGLGRRATKELLKRDREKSKTMEKNSL